MERGEETRDKLFWNSVNVVFSRDFVLQFV